MATVLDGNATAKHLRAQLQQEIAQLPLKPKLVVVLVGDNPASKIYVRKKEKQVKEAGAFIEVLRLPVSISEKDLLAQLTQLNEDVAVTAILVQLPLPKHINKDLILEHIKKEKDIDGLHPQNLKDLEQGNEHICPCTPRGVIALLEAYNIPIKDKTVIVVGYSKLVGLSVGWMCKNRGAKEVIHCRKTWDNLHESVKGDILISATGVPHLIKKENIKQGAVIVDVGISRTPEGKIVGDVDFEDVKEKASYVTPVPGGVGPMTVAMVVANLLTLHKQQQKTKLRKEIREKRKQIGERERTEKSKQILDTLMFSETYQKAKQILFYVGKEDEVQTKELIQKAFLTGKQAFVPFVDDDKTKLGISQIYSFADLETGAFGILEPKKELQEKQKKEKKANIQNMDLILVPGLVFDKQGNRIGYGVGYYDRLLPHISEQTKTIGLAFHEQIKEDISWAMEKHDIKIQEILTDKLE